MTERPKYLQVIPSDGMEVASEALSREQRRSRRKRAVRARTIDVKRTTKRELALGAAENPLELTWRPMTRGDCLNMARPCPFVSCKHNLYLDVNPVNGSIKLNFPDLEPDEMGESCVLDVADRGYATLEETGGHLNLTRQRVRQCETFALAKVAHGSGIARLCDSVINFELGDGTDKWARQIDEYELESSMDEHDAEERDEVFT